jgi:hypothetical protein
VTAGFRIPRVYIFTEDQIIHADRAEFHYELTQILPRVTENLRTASEENKSM